MSGAWSRLRTVPMRYPFAFGMTISTFKTSASDLLVQKVVEQKEVVDWKRNAAFAAFGCFYLGGVQYMIYVPLFSRIFPNAASFAAKGLRDKFKDIKGMGAVAGQVFLDQCVHHPLMYFPVFYITKELVMNDKDADIMRVLRTYKDNMKEDMLALWKIWVPSTILNFAFMPMWARIPWVACTSLVWTCILSSMRGGDVAHKEELAGLAVTGATLKIMKEGLGELFAKPVELDPKLSHISVSAAGPDRIGWVALVAETVAKEGGSVTHSKMLRMGHEFTIIMHVSVPPEKQRKLLAALGSKELKPLNIRTSSLTRRQTRMDTTPAMALHVHCVGKDRPGMLATLAEKLSNAGMSVEDISTEQRMGIGGRRDFVINAVCVTKRVLDDEELATVVKELGTLEEKLGLDVLDIRVHMDTP
uniref:ACT domain-containing protein n=1 Tax=Attheya septentrionalis TaxID=420275 RepID=A0A7S2UHF2_9STRA|mmetsp:Transcript_22721/g.41074  ORF Transcript_22721/g.41074 Transcript_22721/m.41074 type:complete len:416 (+) Transcript_22721:303-1550(+)|eukprot:CAMPEP_0198286726 /NCGR_PEP_ID=MMETSP1449-20131203/5713_1 /TAXON_ID=420275 /ORGANISM="Attheya septentrionalis, Strain CCMP2084" /LENGTH=415 /DNA_ID=CAMNT_0043984511 /DNA_START=213 /DNA_END=1460 /DNA_ORIENTATION=-